MSYPEGFDPRPNTADNKPEWAHARTPEPRESRRTRRRVACSGRARDVLDYIEQDLDRRDLVTYPFPLHERGMGYLRLPSDGLYRQEAERLKAYIDALVTEAPRASA